MEDAVPDERCYFGCEAEGFHTLLLIPPPFNRIPRLCAPHSKSWRTYKSSLSRDVRWPEDFWPWADKELETMKQQMKHEEEHEAQQAPEVITASEAVIGQWYVVPSGEIEEMVGFRGGDLLGLPGRAGFLHVGGNRNDSEDIRWLPLETEVIPASPREVVAWVRGCVEAQPVLRDHPSVRAILEAPAEALREAASEEPAAFATLAHRLSPLFSSESGEWQTDPDTFAWLDGWAKARWGSGFVLDVCASKENALCDAYFTKEQSCLTQPTWFGPWFENPPYGDPEHPCKAPHERCKKKTCEKRGAHAEVYAPGIGDFVLAGRRQAQAGHPGMCLLPFRPDTEWWRAGVLAPDGEQVAMGGDWAQGWSWVRWSSGLLVETRLISGRLSFIRPGGGESWTAPFPSVVVVFDRWK